MHPHVLFEDLSGRPVARTRRGADGTERRPDGVRYFDLDGAVQRFNVPLAELLAIWDDSYADLPWSESPVLGVVADAGVEGLTAVDGAARASSPAAGTPRDKGVVAAFRRAHYGHLDDDQFLLFIDEAQRRGLDPFCKQVIARKEEDWRTGEQKVSTITTAGAFVLLAQRSGQFEGLTPVEWAGEDGAWKELWPDGVEPTAARQGVYRKGFREPIWGVVYWKERAPYWPDPVAAEGADPTVLDPFWKKQPRHMIGKCARVEAIRQAFGEELAGVYCFDEMTQADAGRKRQGPRRRPVAEVFAPTPAAGDDYAIPAGRRVEPSAAAPFGRELPDDAIPENDEEFAAALKRIGFDDPDVRKKVIGYWHGQLSDLFNCNPTAAYARALDRIRQNPEHYGARSRGRRSPALT